MKKFFLPVLFLLIVGIPSCDLLKESLGGSIEGTVSGNNVNGGFVILLSSIDDLDQIQDLSESGLSAITDIVKGFGLIGSDGSFEILAVPSGEYYMVAAIDADGNNTLDTTDMIGWYGNDTSFTYVDTTSNDTIDVTITIPVSFVVAEKEKKTGMDIKRLMSKQEFEKYYDYINQ